MADVILASINQCYSHEHPINVSEGATDVGYEARTYKSFNGQ